MSLCSQGRLLPHGAPPMPMLACFTWSPSEDTGVCRVLTTTNVGHGARGLRITKCYPLVVHSILRHFARCLGVFCRIIRENTSHSSWMNVFVVSPCMCTIVSHHKWS